MIELQLIGMDHIQKNLDRLTVGVRDRLLKRSVRAAAEPVARHMEANAPVDLGTYRDAIGVKYTSKGGKGEWVRAIIGIRTKRGVPVRIVRRGGHKGALYMAIPTRYAHLIEFGHDVVVNGQVVGRVPPNPVMRNAWDVEGGEVALFRFEETMRKGVAAEVAMLPANLI